MEKWTSGGSSEGEGANGGGTEPKERPQGVTSPGDLSSPPTAQTASDSGADTESAPVATDGHASAPGSVDPPWMMQEYVNACETIARMHAAAVGEVRGPTDGVVADVAALRAFADALVEAVVGYGESILGGFTQSVEGKRLLRLVEDYRAMYPKKLPESMPHKGYEMCRALAVLLDAHNAEAVSDTPDFVLAKFLRGCLVAFDGAVLDRETWYGRTGRGGGAP